MRCENTADTCNGVNPSPCSNIGRIQLECPIVVVQRFIGPTTVSECGADAVVQLPVLQTKSAMLHSRHSCIAHLRSHSQCSGEAVLSLLVRLIAGSA